MKDDIQIGDFVQFTFSETHGILAGQTDSGEVIGRTGDLVKVRSGNVKCIIFLKEINCKINPKTDETDTDNSDMAD